MQSNRRVLRVVMINAPDSGMQAGLGHYLSWTGGADMRRASVLWDASLTLVSTIDLSLGWFRMQTT
jgi:hypothetical protein